MTALPKSLAIAGILALSWMPAAAQMVRVHEWTKSTNLRQPFVRPAPTGYRLVWSDVEFCPGTSDRVVIGRTIDPDGRFSSGDTQVTTTCSSGLQRDLAVLPSGAFLAVSDAYGDGAGSAIGGRAFDSNGNPLGPDFLVNQDPTGWQREPFVAALDDRYVVTWWVDPSGTSNPATAWGRIVMADGTMPYPERMTSCGNTREHPEQLLAGKTPSGAPLLCLKCVWNYARPKVIYSQLTDDTLAPVGPLNVAWQKLYVGMIMNDVVTLPQGVLLAYAYRDTTAATSNVYGLFLDPTGKPLGPEFRVNETAVGTQASYRHSAGADASGGFVFARDTDQGALHDVYAKRFDAQGNALGPEFPVPGLDYDNQLTASVAVRPNGDFLVTFVSAIGTAPNVYYTYARRYAFPVSLVLAPGPGPANVPSVETRRPDGRLGWSPFSPYGASGYGANVGGGDIDADKLREIVTGPGPGFVYGPQVRAFEREGTPISPVNFFAYGTLRYGVRGTGGDVAPDSSGARDEILSAAGAGDVFGPHIRGFRFDGAKVAAIPRISFFAYKTLRWGARVVPAEMDQLGSQELVTAPGPGAIFGPQVRSFAYDQTTGISPTPLNIMAFATGSYGATIGAADIESDGVGGYGDGYDELVVGRGPGPSESADIVLFDFDPVARGQIYSARIENTLYGLSVSGGDADKGDAEEVVTAPGPDPAAPARIRTWDYDEAVYYDPGGARLHNIGPDDFLTFPGSSYGASIAIIPLE